MKGMRVNVITWYSSAVKVGMSSFLLNRTKGYSLSSSVLRRQWFSWRLSCGGVGEAQRSVVELICTAF